MMSFCLGVWLYTSYAQWSIEVQSEYLDTCGI